MKTRLILALLAGFFAAIWTANAFAQDSDATSEVKILRTTNERLLRENEALREELDALKQKLAEAKPATRPAMLSAAGAATEPKKIVYIIDASGSMMDVFDSVRDEVRRSIEELRPDQFFAVVLDQESPGNPFPKTLLAATEENKRRVLGIFPKLYVRGSDNFTASLKTALAMNPDLIWWRGDEPQMGPSDLNDIKKWNARKVRINTSPRNLKTDPDGKTLWFAWKLASDSGGTCFDEQGVPVTEAPSQPPPQPRPQ